MLLIRPNGECLQQTWPFIFTRRDCRGLNQAKWFVLSAPPAPLRTSLCKSRSAPCRLRRLPWSGGGLGTFSLICFQIYRLVWEPLGPLRPGARKKLICTAAAASRGYTSFYTNITHSWPQSWAVTESGGVSLQLLSMCRFSLSSSLRRTFFNVCNFISHDVLRYCERPSESARRLWDPVLIPPCDGSSLKGWHSFRWVEASWWMQSVFVASEVRATVAPRGRIQLGRTVSVNMESSFTRFHQHVPGLCQTPTWNHARCARREELLALSFMISYLKGWKYFQLSTFIEGTN